METTENENKTAGAPSALNVGLDVTAPIFTFRGDELVNLLWKYWAEARVMDAMEDWYESRGMQKEPDAMENQDALNTLKQEMAIFLMSLPVRDDGTVEFTETPFIVTANVQIEGPPLCGGPARMQG